MNWTDGLQAALNYIESNICDNKALAPALIARQSLSSEDNFRKIFHLITGYTIGEYIRNRRMSLAGEAVLFTEQRIIDIALKYGYDSAESFTKAFLRFHGSTPSAIRKNKSGARSFTRIILKVIAEGGTMLDYKIITLNGCFITGFSKLFEDHSTEKNNVLIPNFTASCCSMHWDEIVRLPSITTKGHNYIFGYRDSEAELLRYTIGSITSASQAESDKLRSYDHIRIPDGTWICFECHDQTVKGMQSLWYKIYTEFLPFSSYSLIPDITLECSSILSCTANRYLLIPVKPDNY